MKPIHNMKYVYDKDDISNTKWPNRKKIIRIIWYSLFPLFMVTVLALIIFSDKGPADSKTVANWDGYESITEQPVKEIKQIQYEPATFVSDGKTSYWFIYAKEKGTGSTYWNSVVKQEHSYFSVIEAMDYLKKETEGKKDFFLISFQQVSEPTYIEYEGQE